MSRSLRRSCRRYEVRVDTAFEQVIDGLRRPAPARTAGSPPTIRDAYRACTSWLGPQRRGLDARRRLAGGLYGVAIGGLFAGESMFHRRTDASKVALVGLVDAAARAGGADRCSTSSG